MVLKQRVLRSEEVKQLQSVRLRKSSIGRKKQFLHLLCVNVLSPSLAFPFTIPFVEMMNRCALLARALPRQPARCFATVSRPVLSSRGPARTGLKDLHPLPAEMRDQLEAADANDQAFSSTGNATDPAVHSSRPESQPAEPDVDPKVAAPNLAQSHPNQTQTSSPPTPAEAAGNGQAWDTSFSGLGQKSFGKEVADVLNAPINPDDIEITPGKPKHK